jgi:putative transposase
VNHQPLPPYNFPVGTIIEIDARPHRIPVEHIPGRLTITDCHTGQPFLIPDGNGGTVLPSPTDYDRLVIDGRVEVKFPPSMIAAQALMTRAEWDMSDLEEFDPGIRWVIKQVDVLDAAGVKNGIKAMETALRTLWTQELRTEFGDHAPPQTIKHWRAKGKPGARDHRLLVRMAGRTARRSLDRDVAREIRMKHALLCVGTKGRIKTAYAAAATELVEVNEGRSADYPKPIIPHPLFSYSSFRRDCIALEGSDTSTERDGEHLVESKMRGGGKPLTASRILEKVIIDHTPLDAFVVVDPERDIVAGRPWLTLAIDVHSRAILAWVITFRPPSYWTVAECLRRMNLPKRPPPADAARYPILVRICGKPCELILDNAVEFTGHGLEDAARSGSFSVRFCPIEAPRYRAIGERAMGTIPRLMLEHLPGATMPITYIRRSKHDAEDLAVATMNEIEAIANKAIADYHTDCHDGINGQQPALAFQKSANRHGIDVMADVWRWRLETMESRQNVTVSKSGVRIFGGLRYYDQEGVKRLIDNCLRFEPRRQARVDATIHTKVKFDPGNIAVIHVWDKTTLSYVELRCQDETYADGMPLWFHRELLELAKAEATAEPKETAKPRGRRLKAIDGPEGDAADDAVQTTLRRMSELEGEEAPKGFNTEAERLEARARRITAIRAIGPRAASRERDTVARLYEIPRLRQITGNIVHLDTDFAKSATTDDFISHDVSAMTALDLEIRAPRPEKTEKRERTGKGDSREAGQPRRVTPRVQQEDEAATGTDGHVSRRRRNTSH